MKGISLRVKIFLLVSLIATSEGQQVCLQTCELQESKGTQVLDSTPDCVGKNVGDACTYLFGSRSGVCTAGGPCQVIGETVCGCGDPPQDNQNPGGGLDPEITTWNGRTFDYRGICDIVLLRNTQFRNGLGLEVQIRTKEYTGVNTGLSSDEVSKISNIAVRIGSDVLEIQGPRSDLRYWFNGVEGEKRLDEIVPLAVPGERVPKSEHVTFGNGLFPVTLRNVSDKTFQIRILLGKEKGVLFLEAFGPFLNVHLMNDFTEADFGESVGLMGRYPDGAWLSRDGYTIISESDPFAFGDEWQVLPEESTLFHSVEGPQSSKGEKCIRPETLSVQARLRRG